MKIKFRPETFKRLVTKRLVLRQIYDSDSRDLYNNIYSNYEWHKYGYPRCINSVFDCASLIGRYAYQTKKGDNFAWGVVEKESAEMIGIVLLYSPDLNRSMCKMGCLMSFNHSKQGYAKEAVSKVVNFAFNELNINKIQIEIVRHNIPSLKLAKKLGMRYEYTKPSSYKIGDELLDENVYFKLNPKYVEKILKK